jgi:hypothetical protein
MDSGATVIDSSGCSNGKSILSKSNDEYLIISKCNQNSKSSLIIHLSEDVTVDAILVQNREDFSANLAEIKFFGSIDYPVKNESQWISLSSIIPNNDNREYLLNLNEKP